MVSTFHMGSVFAPRAGSSRTQKLKIVCVKWTSSSYPDVMNLAGTCLLMILPKP